MKNKTIEKVKDHIESCMKSFYNSNSSHRDIMYQRLDELFLLWGKLKNITFVKSVEDFGLDYSPFTYKHYDNILVTIGNKFPELIKE